MTIINIPNVGSPTDDPNLLLPGKLYVPTTPQPWNVVAGTVASQFKGNQNLNPINQVLVDLCNAGYLCLATTVRLLVPIPGQTTSGKWPQQTNDLKIAIRAMRDNPFELGYDVTGKVFGVGGSGSAGHAAYCALDGTDGDDKFDASLCMSAPLDYSDRTSDVPARFVSDVTAYADTTDLTTLYQRSPIGLELSNANPIRDYNGTSEEMPLSQQTRFTQAMEAASAVNYSFVVNTGTLAKVHSFPMWPSIKSDAIAWLNTFIT